MKSVSVVGKRESWSPKRLLKKQHGRKKQASGAEAQTHFQAFNGTTEVVPFPKLARVDLIFRGL